MEANGSLCREVLVKHVDEIIDYQELNANKRDKMTENIRKQPTTVEEATDETSHEEVFVENICKDLEAQRYHEYVTNKTFIDEKKSPEIKIISVNKVKHTLGNSQQLNNLLNIKGYIRKTFPCNLCDKVLKSKSGHQYHMKTHRGKNSHTCHHCNYSCISASTLKLHMNTHIGEKSFNCQLCTYSCSQFGNLRRHMMTHTGEKSFNCQLCTYSCIQVSDLRTHMMIHSGEKSYDCQQCAYTCRTASNLRSHKRVHTGGKTHTCHLCTLNFNHRKSLKSHVCKENMRTTELIKKPNEKPVKQEQVADLSPVISNSGFEGQSI